MIIQILILIQVHAHEDNPEHACAVMLFVVFVKYEYLYKASVFC